MIGITCASGGFLPLEEILAELPRAFPVPIVVIPSIANDFVGALVNRIGRRSLLRVMAVEDGQVPEPGTIHIAGGHRHVVLEHGQLKLIKPEPRSYIDKDVFFWSMAAELGSGAIAVILSGMGRDGAAGMKEVRKAGGYTIAQDPFTALVYATPRVAVEMDAACESLRPREIAARLLTLVEMIEPGTPYLHNLGRSSLGC